MRLRDYVTRRQEPSDLRHAVLAGAGTFVAIAILALTSDISHLPLLAAPFGASCVLVYAMPQAPVSQPVNVIAGYLLSSAIAIVVAALLPIAWWSMALAVAAAISLMTWLRVTHPPAAAQVIVIMATGAGWSYLLTPTLVGAALIVLLGIVFHHPAPWHYPIRARHVRHRGHAHGRHERGDAAPEPVDGGGAVEAPGVEASALREGGAAPDAAPLPSPAEALDPIEGPSADDPPAGAPELDDEPEAPAARR